MVAGEAQRVSVGDAGWLVNPSGPSRWRSVVRRPATFAVESKAIDFQSPPSFGSRASVTIPRAGDLLSQLFLQVTLTKLDNRSYDEDGAPLYCRGSYYPVEALVKDVAVTVGGQRLDRHTSDWLRVFDSVHRGPEASEHYKRLTNFDAATVTSALSTTETLYLPLAFSFCRHPGLALPLLCMWNTEVRVEFTFASAEEVGVSPEGFTATLFGDFVLLGAEEKAQYLQREHEYLVEEVQTAEFTLPPDAGLGYTARLNFYNPVKCLYWVLRDSTQPTERRSNHARYVGDFEATFLGFQPSPASPSGLGLVSGISERMSPIRSARLVLDGADRVPERQSAYFNKVVPAQCSRRCPLPGLHMFSFSLSPESLAVTGVCNFSAFREQDLVLGLKRSVASSVASAAFEGAAAETTAASTDASRDLRVFALGYNVLRISDGVAALRFGS